MSPLLRLNNENLKKTVNSTVTNSATTTILKKYENQNSRQRTAVQLHKSYWLDEETEEPQMKFNIDKHTEKVQEEKQYNSFLGILTLKKILLARKEVIEFIISISTEIHQFRMFRIWKGMGNKQKIPLQQPRKPWSIHIKTGTIPNLLNLKEWQ